ncbi:MAG: Uncharacterized protein LiPW39_125 [Parcubacteria group bacterium LiPW_39]|nr:MAG: Uncharacterized protein LiPW39_125 [Parcubacteria group bacterium LiPW_39]
MQKIINLKPEEEVTTAVEYLWETGAEQVYFVVSDSSVFLRNIIGLKLLKREADRLGKTVVLVTKDEVGREMAKRVGLASRAVMPKISQAPEELSDQDILREMPPKEFESLIKEEVEIKRRATPQSRRMSDIKPKKIETKSFEEKKSMGEFLPSEREVEPEMNEPIFFEPEEIEIKKEEFLPEAAEEMSGMPARQQPIAQEFSKETEWALKKERKLARLWPAGWLAKVKKSFVGAPKPFQPYQEKKDFIPTKFLAVFIGAAVLIAVAVLYFILPKAEINIVPKSEAFSQDLNLVTDKGINKIDLAQNKIPAQLIKLDKKQSQEFSATGSRQLNEKARGTITIFNEYSSSPQVLVAKTRFISDNEKVFRITKSITIPGAKIQEGKIIASSVDAEVVADQAGEEYNIGPGNFKIPGFQGSPKYNAFYGRSKAAMSGGAAGTFRVVSQEDFDKAKNNLWQSLQPALDKEFRAQIPNGFKIIDNALKEEISSVSSDVEVGGRAEKFILTLKGTAKVLLFDEKDILQIATQKIADRIKDNQQVTGKIDQINYSDSQADFSKGQLSFRAKINGKVIWKIDADQLQKEMAGQDENAVKEILARHQEIANAQIIFWPFWVKSVPDNLDKVKVKLE